MHSPRLGIAAGAFPLAAGPHPRRDLSLIPRLGFTVLGSGWPRALPSAPGCLATDVDGLEPGIAPLHDEDAEALLHARLDVVRVRRVAARHVELFARRQHLLDRVLPGDGV